MPTGTVTMLFTDIEGSTRLLKQLGEHYGDLLGEHRRILRDSVARFGGREMDTQGDAFFFAFGRARDAVGAAVSAQRGLASGTWPEGAECRVRMGLHTGEPEVGDEGYHGMAVHRGARICAAAHGGQVLLSDATRQLVEDDLPPEVTLRPLGEAKLKDLDRPERLYQVVVQGLASDFPPLRTGGAAAKPARPRRRLVASVVVVLAAVAVGAFFLIDSGGSSTSTAKSIAANSVGVYRADNGKLTGRIDVGTSPNAIAAGPDALWVVNVDDSSVSRIDPAKGVAVQTIKVGNGPAGIAVGGGFVWVTNGLDGTVSKIDPQTNGVVQTVTGVGNGPAGIAVGRRVVWVANSNDDTVARLSLATGEVLGKIPVDGGADGLAIGYGSVWVTGQATGTLTRLDERSGTVLSALHVGSGPDAVTVGANGVWTANNLDGTVTQVDPGTTSIRATIPVGGGPNGIVTQSGAVWVSNELAETLARIDPLRATVVQTVNLGNPPQGLALDEGKLYTTVGTAGAGHRGGTLEVLTGAGHIDSIDPAVAYAPLAWQILTMTNDGLVTFKRVGGSAGSRLVPDLATALPVPTGGGRSYSFQLRPGIRYSTGKRVRPEDFRWAAERSLSNPESPAGTYLAGIVGAKACIKDPKHCDLSKGIVTDDQANIVTFHLVAPDPEFLYELALPYAFAVPPSTPIVSHRPVAATGPYMIASYDGKILRLVRNPRFRQWSAAAQPNGYPNTIVMRLTGTPDSHIAAVAKETADLAMDGELASPSVLGGLKTQHASRIEPAPAAGTLYFLFNVRGKPFDDVRARRAVNYAVDRNKLMALAGGPDLGQVTCQILPPNFDAYRPYCPYTTSPSPAGTYSGPDLAKARALVVASGTRGAKVAVWAPQRFEPEGKYLVSVLNQLGYRASLRTVEHLGDVLKAASAGSKVQIGAGGWFADFATPSGFFVPALSCGAYVAGQTSVNAGAFCDQGLDRTIARARTVETTSPETASRLWSQVDRGLVDQAAWIPWLNPRDLEFLSERVGNYQYNPQWGTLLDQLWVNSS
jgi:YVTN family beta-propeller protein